MQKLLKTHYFMNKMYEYEMKFFSKTLEFNPDLPKTIFSINLSSKTQTLKHILHQNQGTFNLGWLQQVHTQYHVLSLAKNNLCSVSN